ncbi:hypothetical protein V8G54_021800 [Vigna mungo]|uniref:Reverse transcriptase Ty1/copia-type domain-containing protein n=1 Tax=Vigna mungo TaxID=3915 RepID=A0AAQ3RUM4_VIGMU
MASKSQRQVGGPKFSAGLLLNGDTKHCITKYGLNLSPRRNGHFLVFKILNKLMVKVEGSCETKSGTCESLQHEFPCCRTKKSIWQSGTERRNPQELVPLLHAAELDRRRPMVEAWCGYSEMSANLAVETKIAEAVERRRLTAAVAADCSVVVDCSERTTKDSSCEVETRGDTLSSSRLRWILINPSTKFCEAIKMVAMTTMGGQNREEEVRNGLRRLRRPCLRCRRRVGLAGDGRVGYMRRRRWRRVEAPLSERLPALWSSDLGAPFCPMKDPNRRRRQRRWLPVADGGRGINTEGSAFLGFFEEETFGLFDLTGSKQECQKKGAKIDWPSTQLKYQSQLLVRERMGSNPTLISKETMYWGLPAAMAVGRRQTAKIVDADQTSSDTMLVAKEFTQIYGVDYLETFALVSQMNEVKVFLSLAANHGLNLQQFDVKNAFLHMDLEEEIYMEVPSRCIGQIKANTNCKLRKALYGLKQSPRAWLGRFTKVMLSLKYKGSNSSTDILDDIIVTGNDEKEQQKNDAGFGGQAGATATTADATRL